MGTYPFGKKVAMDLDHVDLVFLSYFGFWKMGDQVGRREREGIIIYECTSYSFIIKPLV